MSGAATQSRSDAGNESPPFGAEYLVDMFAVAVEPLHGINPDRARRITSNGRIATVELTWARTNIVWGRTKLLLDFWPS